MATTFAATWFTFAFAFEKASAHSQCASYLILEIPSLIFKPSDRKFRDHSSRVTAGSNHHFNLVAIPARPLLAAIPASFYRSRSLAREQAVEKQGAAISCRCGRR